MISIYYAEQIRRIEEKGIVIMRDVTAFVSYGRDTIWPYFTLALCDSGSTRALYDMQEIVHSVNDIACIMPGHMHRPLESSEDFKMTFFVLSRKFYEEFKYRTFSHDADKFNITPICHLKPEQAQHMISLTNQLETIAGYTEEELPHRKEMIFAILAVGYEFLNFYRREQDMNWTESRHQQLFMHFSELVVAHHRKSRDVKFYADLLHLTPKHLTKLICTYTGGMTPASWIDQYVVAQAKHLLTTRHFSVKETAYQLGFTESASFCRFFKRIAGLTPNEYTRRTAYPLSATI